MLHTSVMSFSKKLGVLAGLAQSWLPVLNLSKDTRLRRKKQIPEPERKPDNFLVVNTDYFVQTRVKS
jgi:hypothetical protein